MKLSIALSLLPLLAHGSPVAVFAPESSPLELEARADKTCQVTTSNVNCRAGAGTGYRVVRLIQPGVGFGVRCKAKGEWIIDTDIWDWIPGWSCWVTAHYTNYGCESNVPWC
ncbi:hypothetical protein N656DRAFT_797830 [Canariomyces notabilis]|uniref:SH3 domain-containing protein n=1 Tax=Canariomyces notabilis TaxID=2074819 RepID=A0AAN6TF47_9PEZI|nr:hypothetical protein N656DRAFT_797830 [Canariomyces arenarius]